MEETKPNVFIINIHPENWEACRQAHIFGLRKGTRHPTFRKGDVFLVRRTGVNYGVAGIWLFKEQEDITDSHKVPWCDAEYTILLSYDPIVDFQTPISEEFAGASKFSSKIQISVARLIGSVATIYEPEIIRYLEAIIEEKSDELSGAVDYEGKTTTALEVLNGLLASYREQREFGVEQPKEAPTIARGIREEDFYKPFADWLINEVEEATKAIPLGGNKFRDKWGTPDVIGIRESRRSDIITFPTEIVSAEVKADARDLITAFGQACLYRLFSHKCYIVIPKNSPEEDIFRIDTLCLIFGMGLVLFNTGNIDQPEFEIRVRPLRHEPDMLYVNRYLKLIERELF